MNIKDLFENYSSFKTQVLRFDKDEMMSLNENVKTYLVFGDYEITDSLVDNVLEYLKDLDIISATSLLRNIKKTIVKNYKESDVSPKPYVNMDNLLKKVLTKDNEFAEEVSRTIKNMINERMDISSSIKNVITEVMDVKII